MKLIPIGLALLLLLDGTALATLKQANSLLLHGEYAGAEAAFRKLKSPQAHLGLARVELATGRYKQAAATARKAARGKLWPAAMTLVAEVQRQTGRVALAEATLKRVMARHSGHYRALIQLALAQLEQGKTTDARQTLDRFYDDYAAGKIDKTSAEQVTYVAMACRYSDNFRDAADTLVDAVKQDPRHVEAYIQWGDISLEKYEAGYAEKHYADALKINPHHPEALVGMARVKLEQTNDADEALKLLARAEKVNPFMVDAQLVRAQILVDDEQNSAAEALLTRALSVNPRHLDALSMMAASYFLRDDPGSFQRMKAQVFKLNPRYTQFFRTVVQLAVRHHRYQEAIDLGKQAIAIDPADWYSLADLGTNHLRLGDDQNGLKYLRQAWKGDPFNVRTFNLLNLFDDVVAKEYLFISSKHFRFRVHKQEKELVQRTIAPLLERAYGIYVKKYKFKPVTPIIIELFRNPRHYAVRTVGVPGLGALGVCFGRVITATSPLSGGFNWGQVLWHELNHVFTIQLSRSRVPRWLTEGLADLEPILERPEWKRENDFDIYRALKANRLRGVGAMSTAFTRAKNINEMVVAYYQGSLMARFLVKKHGMDRMLEALKAYGRGKRTSQILPAVTGQTLEQLDREFQAEERRRLAAYNRNWFVDPEQYSDLKVRRQAATQGPSDKTAQAALAAALLVAGMAKQADQQADRALALDATQRLALFVKGQTSLARRDLSAAGKALQALVAAGGDGYDAQLGLGKVALARKQLGKAALHLDAAKRFDPERPEPYVLLARAYDKSPGHGDQLIAELKGLAKLDQQSFSMVGKLVHLLARRKDHAGVRTYGQMAYFIHPASAKLHVLLGQAFAAPAPKPDLTRAIWHLETALLCHPQRPVEIHLQLGRIYLRKGDRRRARSAVEAALKAEPGNAEARALKQRIR